MNEQLQKALIEIITKATTGMETAVSFLSAEIPDVIHQLLMWKMIESLIYFSMGWVMVVLLWVSILFSRGRLKKSIQEFEPTYEGQKFSIIMQCEEIIFIGFAQGMLAVVIPLVIFMNITWLKILIAPKLYLIEYAAQLIK